MNPSSYKIVLLGETSVGKSSIISKYIHNTFHPSFEPTLGSTYSSKTILLDDSFPSITLLIWDTAGQEKYKSLSRVFYKDAHAVILVYDITREDTFTSIQSFWLDEIRVNAPRDAVIAIVGNKCDLDEQREGDEKEQMRFALQKGYVYREVSAKEGKGVEEMFEEVARRVCKESQGGRRMGHSGSITLNSWSGIYERKKCCFG